MHDACMSMSVYIMTTAAVRGGGVYGDYTGILLNTSRMPLG